MQNLKTLMRGPEQGHLASFCLLRLLGLFIVIALVGAIATLFSSLHARAREILLLTCGVGVLLVILGLVSYRYLSLCHRVFSDRMTESEEHMAPAATPRHSNSAIELPTISSGEPDQTLDLPPTYMTAIQTGCHLEGTSFPTADASCYRTPPTDASGRIDSHLVGNNNSCGNQNGREALGIETTCTQGTLTTYSPNCQSHHYTSVSPSQFSVVLNLESVPTGATSVLYFDNVSPGGTNVSLQNADPKVKTPPYVES